MQVQYLWSNLLHQLVAASLQITYSFYSKLHNGIHETFYQQNPLFTLNHNYKCEIPKI